MNVQDWGAIAEIIGAAAVVISIVYLSIQIRSNTRATKAGANFDATHSWATINELVSGYDPSFLKLVLDSYKADTEWESIDELNRMRISLLHRALFQKLEGQYYLYTSGYLELDLWKKRCSWAAGLVKLPFYAKWWEDEKQLSIYSDRFIEAIDSSATIQVKMTGIADAT